MRSRINSENWKTRVPIIGCTVLGLVTLTLLLVVAALTEYAAAWMLIVWMIGASALVVTGMFALCGSGDTI